MMSKFSGPIHPVKALLEDMSQGRMIILVDDENRENEGDLVIPAQMATPDVINFMAKYGRGLICLPMTEERIEYLGLPLMSAHNQSRHETAFTLSIEAREGVTTGISAADRARTISVAIDPDCGSTDLVTPGHVFPLRARDGGVLVRAGHTEASVDLARLAGLTPAAVICEIMNEDGSMARLDDLITFGAHHDLKIGTIADLIAYRRRTERLIERVEAYPIYSRYGGEFQLVRYRTWTGRAEHIALIKGDLDQGSTAPLVRMHALRPLEDILFHQTRHEGLLQKSMEIIADYGRGAVVLLTSESGFFENGMRLGHEAGHETLSKSISSGLRDYGLGAQILLDLNIQKMILLSNSPRTVVGLEGYGLTICGHKEIIN